MCDARSHVRRYLHETLNEHKLQQLAKRLEEIDVQLAGEHAARDMNRFRSLGQERAEIEPVVTSVPRLSAGRR